jgi:hypothetical protein
MPEDFMDMLRAVTDSSNDNDNLYDPGVSGGNDEVQGSRAEGQAPGPGNDPGEQQARRVMLNPAPDPNAQELRKVCLSFFTSIWDVIVLRLPSYCITTGSWARSTHFLGHMCQAARFDEALQYIG